MSDSSWSIGYDVGGTSARVALFVHDSHATMRCVATLKSSLRQDTSPESVIALMHRLGSQVLATHDLDWAHIACIGCGIAAQMDATHAVALNAPNLGWRDVPIQAMAREVFGLDVYFFNDLNVLAWGECVAGAARGKQNVLTVAVGTGVGGAIIAGGKLLVGARGQAAELGHVKVETGGGKPCGCGEYGCVEAYAGGVHLERAVAALAQDAPWREEVMRERGVDLALADAHDAPELVALFTRAADLLATVIANACTLLNPELVLLGGGVFTHCARFRHELFARIPPRVLEVAREGLELEACELGEHAALLGAAALAKRVCDER